MRLVAGVRLLDRPSPANVLRLDQASLPMLMRMQQNGIAVDVDHFRALSDFFVAEEASLEQQLAELVGRSVKPGSGDDVARLLFRELRLGADRHLALTPSGERESTGRMELEPLVDQHPAVALILRWRQLDKLRSTYSDALPAQARRVGDHWRLFTDLLHTRTTTGRHASKDPNLQNIPIRTDLGRLIRAGFMAPPGRLLVVADYSQIEMRMAAHESQDANLCAIFHAGQDVHTHTAMEVFGLPKEQIDENEHRYPCKRVNFAVLYLVTADGLSRQLQSEYVGARQTLWDKPRCQKLLDDWYSVRPGVRRRQEEYFIRARRWEMVWDMFGRWRRVPEVRSALPGIVNAGLRQAANQPIQSGAAGIIKLAMIALMPMVEAAQAGGTHCAPLLPVHDELLFEVDADAAEPVAAVVREVMESVVPLRVPLKADVKVCERWSDK